MSEANDVAIQALSQVDQDVLLSSLLVFHDNLSLGEVDVEAVEAFFKLRYPLIHRLLFVEELNQRVGCQLRYKTLRLLLKVVHLSSHLVLLLQHVVPHLVQCVIEELEDLLHFVLVIVQFADKGLFLL